MQMNTEEDLEACRLRENYLMEVRHKGKTYVVMESKCSCLLLHYNKFTNYSWCTIYPRRPKLCRGNPNDMKLWKKIHPDCGLFDND